MKNLGKYKWPILGAVLVIALSFWLWPKGPKVTIGVEGKYEVTLQGELLQAVPYTHEDAMAVRIASVEPSGKGFRYDIRYMAYAPGVHDLGDYLISAEGKSAEDLRELKVNIKPLLKEDYSGILFKPEEKPIDLDTNYTWLMSLLWILWFCTPVLIFLWGLKTKKVESVEIRQPTTTERLQALLVEAKSDVFDVKKQADLEKLLLQYWSENLNADSKGLLETLDDLRKHPAAGEQVASMERWLHSGKGENQEETVEALMAGLRKGMAT